MRKRVIHVNEKNIASKMVKVSVSVQVLFTLITELSWAVQTRITER